MRQFPLAVVALCLMAGLFLNARTSATPAWFAGLVIAAGCGLGGWRWKRRQWRSALCILGAASFLAGTVRGGTARAPRAFPSGAQDTPVRVQGVLYRSPDRGRESDRIYLDVEQVRYRKHSRRAHLRARIKLGGTVQQRRRLHLLTGERIAAWTTLKRPAGYANPGCFDYAGHMKRKGIDAAGFIKSPGLIVKLGNCGGYPFRRIASRIRLHACDALQEVLADDPACGLVKALLVGDRSDLSARQRSLLRETGLFHLVAISGFHVALIAVLIRRSLLLLRMPRKGAMSATIGLLWLYAAIIEFTPSVTRAVVMATFLLAGGCLDRTSNVINSLGGAAVAVLIANPAELGDAGFQLSFTAVLFITLLAPKFMNHLPKRPAGIGPLLAASFAATLGCLPLTVYHFERFSPSGILLGIPMVPLVGLLILLGFGIALCWPLVPPAGAGLGWVACHVADLMAVLMDHDWAELKLYLRIERPPLWLVAAYTLNLTGLCVRSRVRPVLVLLLSCQMILVVCPPGRRDSGPFLQLALVDVGAGEAILVKLPDGSGLLVDGGTRPFAGFDVGEEVLTPALWRQGIRRLRAVLVTHGHEDHTNGLPAVLRNFDVDAVMVGPCAGSSGSLGRVFALCEARRIPVLTARAGQRFVFGSVQMKVVGPVLEDCRNGMNPNDQSVVARVRYGRISLLLAGDLESSGEARLLAGPFARELKSTILKVPHHGSATSLSEPFFETVDPSVALVSTGISVGMAPEVLARCVQAHVLTLRTDRSGMVRVVTDGRVVRVERHVSR